MKFFTIATIFAAVALAAPGPEPVQENDIEKRSGAEALEKRGDYYSDYYYDDYWCDYYDDDCWEYYYGPGHRYGYRVGGRRPFGGRRPRFGHRNRPSGRRPSGRRPGRSPRKSH